MVQNETEPRFSSNLILKFLVKSYYFYSLLIEKLNQINSLFSDKTFCININTMMKIKLSKLEA